MLESLSGRLQKVLDRSRIRDEGLLPKLYGLLKLAECLRESARFLRVRQLRRPPSKRFGAR